MDFQNPEHLLPAAAQARAAYEQSWQATSVSDAQAATLRDDLVKGPIWVAKFTTSAPVPAQDISRELLLSLVDELNDENVPYTRPDSQPLRFEWVGYRPGVEKDTPEPLISESEKFQRLCVENTAPLTVLYIYGGTFALTTPSCCRKTTSLLSQQTGARVLMVHQRLAPQNSFQAVFLDVFQAYLSLLAPPPNSLHKPIPPSQIVLAGDGSGSTLAFGILQTILRLKRAGKTITFHGQIINPATALPAGLSLLSPVTELTNTVPSYTTNRKTDIFPRMDALPYLQKSFPTCALWPTHPPRTDLYAEPGMLCNPLASPAASEDWTGSCPVWMAGGQEQTVDAALLVTQRASGQGVSVTHWEFEGLVHTFFFVWRGAPQSKRLLGKWGKRRVEECFCKAKGLVEVERDATSLAPFGVEELRGWMKERGRKAKVPEVHKNLACSKL
ncbi:alpha/beta-hydrolase [Aspergillus germanicus]